MTSHADRVAADLGEAGYAVDVETFPTRPSAEPWLAFYAGLSAAAALLIYPLPLAAALLGSVAVVLHARESDGRPLLRRPSSEAATVVAKSPSAPAPELVVLSSLHRGPRRFGDATARRLAVSLHTLMAGVAAAGAAAWVAEAEGELPPALGVAGVVAAAILVALVLTTHRPPASGGEPFDALTEIAPLLRDDAVWLVGLGPGADALDAFLQMHSKEVAGASWLNLEPSPSNAVVAVSEEGAWRERRADRWLMGAAEEAGARVEPYRLTTNATGLLARRRRALTLRVPGGPESLAIAVATARAAFDDRTT